MPAGLLWLYNVAWKLPPDFGRDREGLLYGYVVDAIEQAPLDGESPRTPVTVSRISLSQAPAQ